MAEPSIDPSIISKAFEWAWAGILGLVGIVYKVNDKRHESAAQILKTLDEKIDHEVRCVRIELKGKSDKDDIKEALARIDKSNSHIEKLYANAEIDREKVRNFHDNAMSTMTQQHTKILEAMANCGLRVK
jgi:archaellum component FlaC